MFLLQFNLRLKFLLKLTFTSLFLYLPLKFLNIFRLDLKNHRVTEKGVVTNNKWNQERIIRTTEGVFLMKFDVLLERYIRQNCCVLLYLLKIYHLINVNWYFINFLFTPLFSYISSFLYTPYTIKDKKKSKLFIITNKNRRKWKYEKESNGNETNNILCDEK